VVPDGTGMLLRTIVEHDVFDLEAEAALVKVHVVARLARSGPAVGAGAAAGAAETKAVPAVRRSPRAAVK
jgi:hypothetical protein